jgi:hypothetical protein
MGLNEQSAKNGAPNPDAAAREKSPGIFTSIVIHSVLASGSAGYFNA